MFSNLLVAVKEGMRPDPLIELATGVAAPGARIHLVTLVQAGTEGDEPRRLERARQELGTLSHRLGAQGYDASSDVGLIVVAAAHDLLKLVSERGADLIVIGLAKRSRVGKALLGSDAQRVLMGSPCPVLASRLHDE